MAFSDEHVVIVGASMGGQSAATQLRAGGFTGRITLVGDEPYLPYDRPPLSKKIVTGEWDEEKIRLKPESFYEEKQIELRLGPEWFVSQVDPAKRTVSTVGGEVLTYDHLVLATGGRARRLNIPGRELAGIHQILSLTDANILRDELVSAQRVVVVGAGFIGAETAAALAAHGKDVTLVEVSPAPMAYAIGEEVGDVISTIFAQEGVALETRTTVARYEGDDNGRVTRVMTFDGQAFAADLVIEAVGIIPNVEIAEAAGCRVEGGVRVDAHMRTSVEGIYAIGDIASFPSRYADGPRADERLGHVRIEHWAVAIGHGVTVAKTITGELEPYDELPWFWSDQFGTTYNYAGHAADWDELVWRGDPASRQFSVFYLENGRLAGALCAGRPKDFRGAKMLLSKGSGVDRALLQDPETDLLKYAKSV